MLGLLLTGSALFSSKQSCLFACGLNALTYACTISVHCQAVEMQQELFQCLRQLLPNYFFMALISGYNAYF